MISFKINDNVESEFEYKVVKLFDFDCQKKYELLNYLLDLELEDDCGFSNSADVLFQKFEKLFLENKIDKKELDCLNIMANNLIDFILYFVSSLDFVAIIDCPDLELRCVKYIKKLGIK